MLTALISFSRATRFCPLTRPGARDIRHYIYVMLDLNFDTEFAEEYTLSIQIHSGKSPPRQECSQG
jgi:hypothetical protein